MTLLTVHSVQAGSPVGIQCRHVMEACSPRGIMKVHGTLLTELNMDRKVNENTSSDFHFGRFISFEGFFSPS